MKIKRVIEIEESDLERIREIVERENKTTLSVTTRGTAYITIVDSKPYHPSGDCISREALKEALQYRSECGPDCTGMCCVDCFCELIDNAQAIGE